MIETEHHKHQTQRSLDRAVFLTRIGLLAERVSRAFWPLWSILLIGFAPLMMGLQDNLSESVFWALSTIWMIGLIWTIWYGVRRFHWPSKAEAEARLDQSLPGHPLAAIQDTQAIGTQDEASRAVWQAHRHRMAERLKAVQAVEPDLKISRFDPFGLRYTALLAFVVALIFGTFGQVASITSLASGPGGAALASGPTWEGWAEPPNYTGKPSLYLNDLINKPLRVPEGTRITLRFYGGDGSARFSETVSGQQARLNAPAETGAISFEVLHDGDLTISGSDGTSWRVMALPDMAPSVQLAGPMKREARGKMSQPFSAQDDYGVVSGQARFTLDLAKVDRRYGLAEEPEPREALVLDLPMPITGDRAEFTEDLVDDLSKHPWSGLPVTMTLQVMDARDQTGDSTPESMTLPGRRFFDPLAKAVVEQRRDLLWSRKNGRRVAQVLRAVTNKPEGFVRNESGYLMLRVAIRRLEAAVAFGLTEDVQNEVADALWEVALLFEDGSLADARERMQRAQERLSEAMKNGASKEEIADLMQELREATRDYMRQLAEQQQADPNQQNAQNQNGQTQEITQEQIQAMMDKIQELMEQGRMAEAQQLMEQFNQMMENLQVTQNQPGKGGNNPGEQAMDGLKETLREQQGLSDQAFRDLQEQFNSQTGAGQSSENEGLNGGQGRGQSHNGQGGEQGKGDGQGKGQAQGQQQGEPGGDTTGQSLADRQQALRDQLGQQLGNLPGGNGPEGQAAREALGQAGDAMDRAEDSLRNNDLAAALDQQAEAMQALREGMRNLGEALAQQQQQNQPGQQGQVAGQANQQGRDPLGRESGTRGKVGTDRELLQGEDVYRRARDLLDEIRRRSGEQNRPKNERDYLKRLLDQF